MTSVTETPQESTKRQLEAPSNEGEDPEAKRRRILEETRDVDADSSGSDSDSSEEDSEEEDETAELMRELEKIKKERADQKAKEVRVEQISERHEQLTLRRRLKRPLNNRRSERSTSPWATLCSTPKHSM